MVQYRICPGVPFGLLWLADNLAFRLAVMYQPRHTVRHTVGRYVPSVCLTRISLGMMINAGMLLASSRWLISVDP